MTHRAPGLDLAKMDVREYAFCAALAKALDQSSPTILDLSHDLFVKDDIGVSRVAGEGTITQDAE